MTAAFKFSNGPPVSITPGAVPERSMDSDAPLRRRSVIELEPADVPVIETELFLRETLPPAPARVLEVGAGDGRLAARLALGGWDVTAVDCSEQAVAAARARGVDAVCADFLEYRGGPFDVVAFTRSLHHMPLEPALERAEALLARDGVLILEEFAYERADESTAQYLEDELEEFRELGYLAAGGPAAAAAPRAPGPAFALRSGAGRDGLDMLDTPGALDAPGGLPRDGNPLERWVAYFRDERQVHEGAALARAIAWRFDLLRAERAPYLYRFVATETAGREEAVRALIGLIDREEQLISQGMIQAVGFRLVARLRRPEAGR